MGILSWISRKRPEIRTDVNQGQPGNWSVLADIAPTTAAGVAVGEQSAMRSTAVFAAVRILGETFASLPLHVYRRLDPRGKERAVEHPVHRLLHDQPNPEMTSFTWREVQQGRLALWGNSYAFIQRDQANRPIHLWPLLPDRTRAFRRNGTVYYETFAIDGNRFELESEDVLHVPALAMGPDGLNGISPIRMAREAVGLGLAAEEYGSRFFSNASRPSGLLVAPAELGDEARERLKESWKAANTGTINMFKTVLLEEGVDWKPMGIPPEDAQFLETRKFQVNEIARLYRIPPHMLGDLERSTFSNIEQQSIEFVIHTIRPWLVRWEMEINRKLFGPIERSRYFAEFLVDGLLRGDITSRYGAYAIGRQWGWLSANDVRELENLNPVAGGDVYLSPMNMEQGKSATDPVEPKVA